MMWVGPAVGEMIHAATIEVAGAVPMASSPENKELLAQYCAPQSF
jgi:hypothetical protein